MTLQEQRSMYYIELKDIQNGNKVYIMYLNPQLTILFLFLMYCSYFSSCHVFDSQIMIPTFCNLIDSQIFVICKTAAESFSFFEESAESYLYHRAGGIFNKWQPGNQIPITLSLWRISCK